MLTGVGWVYRCLVTWWQHDIMISETGGRGDLLQGPAGASVTPRHVTAVTDAREAPALLGSWSRERRGNCSRVAIYHSSIQKHNGGDRFAARLGSDHYGNGRHSGTNGGGGEILFIVDQNIVIICPGIRPGDARSVNIRGQLTDLNKHTDCHTVTLCHTLPSSLISPLLDRKRGELFWDKLSIDLAENLNILWEKLPGSILVSLTAGPAPTHRNFLNRKIITWLARPAGAKVNRGNEQ